METRHQNEKNPFSKRTQDLIARIQAHLAQAATPSPAPPPRPPGGAPVKAELLAAPPPPLAPRPLLAQVGEALERYPEVLEGLSPTARRIYTLLLALGLELLTRTLGGRPIPRSLSQVTAFAVNRILALALGIPPGAGGGRTPGPRNPLPGGLGLCP